MATRAACIIGKTPVQHKARPHGNARHWRRHSALPHKRLWWLSTAHTVRVSARFRHAGATPLSLPMVIGRRCGDPVTAWHRPAPPPHARPTQPQHPPM